MMSLHKKPSLLHDHETLLATLSLSRRSTVGARAAGVFSSLSRSLFVLALRARVTSTLHEGSFHNAEVIIGGKVQAEASGTNKGSD
ncbi:hypothetical protein AAC387_Pa01g4127 [Persea americana]